MSFQAVVCSPHRTATEAGHQVLRRGGTAAEAAVAMAAVLSVVMPHFCGIGGDAIWLLSDTESQSLCLSGIGQAFSTADTVSHISVRGPQSIVTTAAAIDTWHRALEHSGNRWGGKLQLADILAPAISVAQRGYEVPPSQAFWHAFRSKEIANWPGFEGIAAASRQGDVLRQDNLALSLKLLSRDGLRSFYEGELAGKIIRGLTDAGISINESDLAATRCRDEAPLALPYRDTLLLAPPPPTQGVTTLQIMGILDRLGPAHDRSSATEYHLLIEAVKAAFADRRLLGNQLNMRAQAEAWLSSRNLDARAEEIDRSRARAWPDRRNDADTVYFAVRDARGHCVSALQSIYFDWGSGVIAGDTGIIWHNRGAGFSLENNSPNRLRPGARPFHTLNPGIALREGKPWLLYGTQGADGQPQTLSVILRMMIDHKLPPADALAHPRFLLGRTFSDSGDNLKIEADAGADCLHQLAILGHEVSRIDARSPLAGQAGIVCIGPQGCDAAHDPRGEGVALGLTG